MQIWVDADACPNVIKAILFRAAARFEIMTTLVANQVIQVPPSPFIKTVQVSTGFDVADNYIAQRITTNDIVITTDIPLADEVIAKGGHVISHRGELLNAENIKQRLAMRDFMEEMRDGGQISGGPPPLANKDKQTFANALDRLLTKLAK